MHFHWEVDKCKSSSYFIKGSKVVKGFKYTIDERLKETDWIDVEIKQRFHITMNSSIGSVTNQLKR